MIKTTNENKNDEQQKANEQRSKNPFRMFMFIIIEKAYFIWVGHKVYAIMWKIWDNVA